jgi:hypothetical protein
MNESDLRDELKRLASASAPGPVQLDLDKMLSQGRRRIRRRRVGALHASVAAAALVVLSAVGLVRVASDQFGGPSQPATDMQIPEAGAGTNPSNLGWMVPVTYPDQSPGTRLTPQEGHGQQRTLVSGHVAF